MSQSTATELLFIVSGPSGSGKGTLLQHLTSVPGVARVPTYTTRAPRTGEEPGVDYVFLDDESFWHRVESGEIFEYTRTYGDHAYGSPRLLIEQGPTPLAVELDHKGMFRVRAQSVRRIVSIFVMAPDSGTAAGRITTRSAEANLEAREANWQEQLQFAWSYDYVLVNDSRDLFRDQALAIATAELARTAGARALLDRRHTIDTTLAGDDPA